MYRGILVYEICYNTSHTAFVLMSRCVEPINMEHNTDCKIFGESIC